jgi:hypothetical protein
VGSGAARGKIGCEQRPNRTRGLTRRLDSDYVLEQGKKFRPDLLLAEKGRRKS